MIFIIGLIIGFFIGFTVAAVVAVSSNDHNPPSDIKKEHERVKLDDTETKSEYGIC